MIISMAVMLATAGKNAARKAAEEEDPFIDDPESNAGCPSDVPEMPAQSGRKKRRRKSSAKKESGKLFRSKAKK